MNNAPADPLSWYYDIPIVTRIYLTAAFVTTVSVVHVCEAETEHRAMDTKRVCSEKLVRVHPWLPTTIVVMRSTAIQIFAVPNVPVNTMPSLQA